MPGDQSASLARATQVRSARAALRRRMAEDAEEALRIIRGKGSPEDERIAATLPAGRLLEAVPGIGPSAAASILAGLGIPAHVLAAGMMLDRRAQLAERAAEAIR
jgi:guanylate kinase